MEKEKINVLVVGVIGSGKSSFINNILELKDEEQLLVENSVESVTRVTQKIEFSKNGIDYNFYDTRGMGEPTIINKINDEALKDLVNFLNKVCSNGIQIVIYLIRGRLTEECLKYYLVFLSLYSELKIPFLLINSGEESFLKKNLKNKLEIKKRIEYNKSFYKKNSVYFENVVLTGFPKIDPNDKDLFNYYNDVIQYSKNSSWDAIESIANNNKIVSINPEIKKKKYFILFEFFIILFSIFKKKDLKETLKKNGVEDEIIEIINNLINNNILNKVKDENETESDELIIQDPIQYIRVQNQAYVQKQHQQTIKFIKFSNWLMSFFYK